MRFFKRKEKGAFAIEAVIGITMFMLTIIAIMFMSVIIRVQANMQYALGQTAKEMSGYFYLIDKVGLAKYVSGKSVDLDAKAKEVNTNIGYIVDFASDAKETAANVVNANDINEIIDVINSSEDDLKNGVTNITNMVKTYKSGEQNPLEHIKLVLQIFGKSLANTAFGRYVGPIACDFLLPKYLTQGDEDDYFKQMGFIEKDGHYIDFTGSELLRDGRSINLVATYELDLSNLTFGMVHTTMKFRQVASTAAWVRPNGENLLAVEELFGQTTATITTTTISVPKPTTTTAAEGEGDKSVPDSETPDTHGTPGTPETPGSGEEAGAVVPPGAGKVEEDTTTVPIPTTTNTTTATTTITTVHVIVRPGSSKAAFNFGNYKFYSTIEERWQQAPKYNNPVVTWDNKGEIELDKDGYAINDKDDHRGNGLCVLQKDEPTDPKQKAKYDELKELFKQKGIDGIEYKNGVPDFSPVTLIQVTADFDMTIERDEPGGTYEQANTIIVNKLNSSETPQDEKDAILAQLPSTFKPDGNGVYQANTLQRVIKKNHLTWHEVNDQKTMQLVPTVVNSTFGHVGGIGEAKAEAKQENGG